MRKALRAAAGRNGATSSRPVAARAAPRIGIALAGGGPLGATYEIGALCALAESVEGLELTRCHVYVGVSAGSFIAAGLANGITPARMFELFIENRSEQGGASFQPQALLRPALREYAARAASLPPLLLGAARDYLRNPLRRSLFASLQRLGRAIPTGVFDSEVMEGVLRRVFSAPGRTNDFRELAHKLFLVATDLDSGEAVPFGAPGFDHVPISTAVRASAALPGLFPPVRVGGRDYVDGALKKTLHASVALKHGAELVLCVNPLVPYDAGRRAGEGASLVRGGLPLVLSQTFRSIIHSRMEVGMAKYASEYAQADVLLFEPGRDDAEMFFTNVFSYASRRRLSEHAYQRTRAELVRRRRELAPILARHGLRLRMERLRDPARSLIAAPPPAQAAPRVAAQLAASLDELDEWLHQAAPRHRQAA